MVLNLVDNFVIRKKKTYWSLAGSLKSFHPSDAIISVMTVLAKTTRENGRHARPSHTRPVPPMLQLTKANPEFSSAEALPCAVTAPFTNFDPCGTGFAIEIIWQLYNAARFS